MIAQYGELVIAAQGMENLYLYLYNETDYLVPHLMSVETTTHLLKDNLMRVWARLWMLRL